MLVSTVMIASGSAFRGRARLPFSEQGICILGFPKVRHTRGYLKWVLNALQSNIS